MAGAGLAAALAGVLAAAGARAGLSLAEAERLALERNADFRVAEAQVTAALAQLKAAREYPNPVLGLSTAKINTDHHPSGTALGNAFLERSYDSIVSLGEFFELGKRGPRRASAEAGVRQSEAQRDDSRRLLLQAVSQAYVAAVEARTEARVLGDSAAALRQEAGIAATRLRAGDLAASDEAQIDVAATQLELSADAARATARTAVVTLETLLGEPTPAGNLVLTDTLEDWPALAIDAATPVTDRPDIRAAEAAVAKAETDLTLARRQRIPDLTVSAQYERQPPDQPNTVGFGVSFPLPLWNRNASGILAAVAARDQVQAQLDKVRVQAAADIAAARVAYDEARLRAETYTRQLQPKSATVVKTVAYAYRQGGAALVELLAAERNDNDIRLATARAQADAAAAGTALDAALNRLDAPPPNRPANPE